jgi:Xaa-Pro dipeptidase
MAADPIDALFGEHLKLIASRADRALAAEHFDGLAIHSGYAPTQFLDDADYPFKVNPHFKAWVPITDNAASLLIYRPGHKPKVLFHRPADYWHRPADLPDAPWTRAVELQEFAAPGDAASALANTPGRLALIGMPGAFADASSEKLNPAGLLARLHYERAVKTPYELECMRRANILGARGHRAAYTAFRAGASEYQAHMQYLAACAQREEEMPYNNIVAYNENAAVLHYQHLERSAPGRLLSFLLDAGAQFRGYAADITRTHAKSDGLFADLVAKLDAAQQMLCAEVRAEVDYRDIHLHAHRLVGDILFDLGVIKIAGADALASGLTGVFFPHGVGHLLGLQVHDVAGLQATPQGGELPRPAGHQYLRLTRRLEPGVVVTIEPGIYFIDLLLNAARNAEHKKFIDWEKVATLRPYGGIRIEDNVATTDDAPENLTRDAFAQIAA